MIYLSEAEVMERYIEGLRQSAERAGEFLTAEDKEKPKLFVEFIDGIKTAAGSAHAMAHYQENPKWLDTRDLLENIITVGMTLPHFSEETKPVWSSIKTSLLQMVETGKKLATMKSMKRVDVLANLDFRAKNADLLGNDKPQA